MIFTTAWGARGKAFYSFFVEEQIRQKDDPAQAMPAESQAERRVPCLPLSHDRM